MDSEWDISNATLYKLLVYSDIARQVCSRVPLFVSQLQCTNIYITNDDEKFELWLPVEYR
jgi:hypothetical protein